MSAKNMFKDEDEEGLADYLPWFRFEVGYTGVTFEETPGLQSTAYVGTKYTSASFKINGITGSYDVTYRLFLFDRAAYYNGEGKTLTYQEFVDNMSALYGDASTQKYFKEIPALADMEETDEVQNFTIFYKFNLISYKTYFLFFLALFFFAFSKRSSMSPLWKFPPLPIWRKRTRNTSFIRTTAGIKALRRSPRRITTRST